MPAARVYKIFLLWFFASTLALLFLSSRVGSAHLIGTDGKSYYSWVRSPFIDGDIQFANDYAQLYPPDPLPPEIGQLTPRGNVVNKYPVGLPLLEVPGFLVGHAIARLLPQGTADGLSAPYQFAVTMSLAGFYLFSFWLLFQGMLRLGAHPAWAGLLCVMMLTGTNLIHYAAKEPAMAHGAGVAVLNAAIYVLSRREAGGSDLVRGAALGLFSGLLFLVRNSNIVLLPIFLAMDLGRKSARWGLAALAGFTAAAALQPLSLYFLWGEWRFSTYPYESFTGGVQGILGTLFSGRHGLLIYHPWYLVLVVLNCLGCLAARRNRPLPVAALLGFLLLLLINGTWWCWWFGVSFGNRGFIEALVPLSVGAAVFLTGKFPAGRLSPLFAACCGGLCFLNGYLWLGFMMQQFPPGGEHTIADAYLWLIR